MSTQEILEVLESFKIWSDDTRQKLVKNGSSSGEVQKFARMCEQVATKVQHHIAGGEANIKSVRIETLKSNVNLFQVVRFRAALKNFSGTNVKLRDIEAQTDLVTLMDGTPVEQLGRREDFATQASFTFGEPDAERHLIETLPTTDPELIREFQQSGTNVIFSITGILLANPVSNKFEILLFELKGLCSPLDLVEPTQQEMKSARGLLAAANGKSPLTEIKSRICQSLGIIDPGDPIFGEALEVAILQATSHGLINDENARIHSLLIGPPGIGKGVVAKAVRAIQPLYKKVEPQAITEDGLYGNSGLSGGKRIVRAGLIPQAHQGAFMIEDFHQANSLKNQRLTTTFAATMESGRCEAANASRTSYSAQVAFHVDSNRLSDVDERRAHRSSKGTKLGNLTADTGMPKNVLTRFDYIAEFERDSMRQLNLINKIAGQPVRINCGEPEPDAEIRTIQVALAMLRNEIPEVEIDGEVSAYLKSRFWAIINVPKQVLNDHPYYADFMTRGVKSYRKFVAAHARICGRNSARNEDVDLVFPYIMRKFETILSWIVGDAHDETNQAARKEARQTCIRLKFSGRTVGLKDLRKQFPQVSDKTIKRDMASICGGRAEDETWAVPVHKVNQSSE